MKFNISRARLLESLLVLKPFFSSHNRLPILGGVLITANDAHISFTCTDLDTWAMASDKDATVEEAGAAVVSLEYLLRAVRAMPDETVTINASSEKWLKLRGMDNGYSFFQMAAEDFPASGAPVFHTVYKAQASDFRKTLRQTIYAASKEETRSLLMGALFEWNRTTEKLQIVATDTYRLCLDSITGATCS